MLILVRQRGPLFEAIIRALKHAGMPVAGADRLRAHRAYRGHGPAGAGRRVAAAAGRSRAGDGAEEPAVRPVAKTSCSRSPRPRRARCAPRLRQQRPDLAAQARSTSAQRRALTPFAFYAELLGAGGGRKAFLSRLGLEANDALDEFLNLALDYETRETPSLQGFVAWLRTASAAVKRDMEMARDEVRVMTVHGAKGLEAPIVILADTTTVPAGPAHIQPRLLALPARMRAPGAPDRMVWVPRKADDVGADGRRARESDRAKREDEYRRLLYVGDDARGRAAGRLRRRRRKDHAGGLLVRAGAAGPAKPGVADGRRRPISATADREALSQVAPDADAEAAQQQALRAADRAAGLAASRGAGGIERCEPITPSDVYDDDAPLRFTAARRSADDKALARGNLVHRLMQSLPDLRRSGARTRRGAISRATPSDFQRRAARRCSRRSWPCSATSASPNCSRPAAAPKSDRRPHSHGRVRVSGQVDRLVVTPKAVLIGDYKTNAPPRGDSTTCRTAMSTQLALYRAVLAQALSRTGRSAPR